MGEPEKTKSGKPAVPYWLDNNDQYVYCDCNECRALKTDTRAQAEALARYREQAGDGTPVLAA